MSRILWLLFFRYTCGERQMSEYDALKMRSLQFLVTEACNLQCVYCYEKHKRTKSLPVEFMKAKIQEEMFNEGYDQLEIHFFGGEPLLRFDAIREVVDWFHQFPWPPGAKPYRFVITTNGTLLNDRMKDWFSRNSRDVTLCLSMDGTPDAQNRNRSNSYEAVARHIPFFRDTWPNQSVKMTISRDTLSQMYEGVVHIHSLGLPVEPNVPFEDIWGDEDSKREALRVYAQQLSKLVSFYHTHPEFVRPRLLFRNILGLYKPDDPRRQWRLYCGAGKQLVCYTADQREYPCARFSPICSARRVAPDSFSVGRVNEKCGKCVFEKLCPTCEGYNFEVTGSCFARTDFHCEFFKLELLASARLCFLDEREQLVQRGAQSLSEREKLTRARKLLAIQAINDLCAPLLESLSAGAV
jgi:uncharacterized protein